MIDTAFPETSVPGSGQQPAGHGEAGQPLDSLDESRAATKPTVDLLVLLTRLRKARTRVSSGRGDRRTAGPERGTLRLPSP